MLPIKKLNPLLFSCLLIITACSKEDDINTEQVISEVGTYIQEGEWGISSYRGSGIDKTANFQGYSFTFNADGVVSVFSDPEMLTGAWQLLRNSGQDDHAHFDLFFGVAETHVLYELIRDWDIEKYTTNKINLYDEGIEETDKLVLTKK